MSSVNVTSPKAQKAQKTLKLCLYTSPTGSIAPLAWNTTNVNTFRRTKAWSWSSTGKITSTLKRNVATLSVSPTTRSILRTDVRRLSARQGRRGYLPCQQDEHNQLKPHFKRRPGQIYVAYSLDPPPHLWWNDYASPAWRGVFNWTMTYRTDSHIFSPVGRLVRRQTTVPQKYTTVASRKTKSIAWFVSKYDTM